MHTAATSHRIRVLLRKHNGLQLQKCKTFNIAPHDIPNLF